MPPLQLLPDVEKLVARFLRTQSDVNALVSGRVYTDRQGLSRPIYPYVIVTRLGGPRDYPHWKDEARLQLEAWFRDGDKPRTLAVIATVEAALWLLPGLHDEGVVTGVQTAGPQWLPDSTSTPAIPRYLLNATVWSHPTPS
jgi:hypothetical protein